LQAVDLDIAAAAIALRWLLRGRYYPIHRDLERKRNYLTAPIEVRQVSLVAITPAKAEPLPYELPADARPTMDVGFPTYA
jgi:hypothetical protein